MERGEIQRADDAHCSLTGPVVEPQGVYFNNTKIGVLKGITYILNRDNQQSLVMQEVTAACTGRSISLTQYYSCMFWDILHKETRAVKLVFLQRVKEVTTDGADAARQPTDIQYWFIAFFSRDKGTTGRRQLSGGEWHQCERDLNISLQHDPETLNLCFCYKENNLTLEPSGATTAVSIHFFFFAFSAPGQIPWDQPTSLCCVCDL